MDNLKHTLLCKILKRTHQKCFGLFVNHVILWNRVLNWWSKSLTKEIIDLQLLGFFRVLASWLLSSVSLNVVPQNMFKTKRLVALGTFVHLFARMADKVIPQSSKKTKWFVALGTFVQLLSTVYDEGTFQMNSLTKWFVALSEFMQFCSTVSCQ